MSAPARCIGCRCGLDERCGATERLLSRYLAKRANAAAEDLDLD